MALDEPKDEDETCELGDVTYLCERDLLDRLGKVSVDFVEQGWRSGFVVASEKPLGLQLGTCGGSCSC